MYSRDVDRSGYCPVDLVGLTYGRPTVRDGKCPLGFCPSVNCLSGICPRASVRRATIQSGYCPDTIFSHGHDGMHYKIIRARGIVYYL